MTAKDSMASADLDVLLKQASDILARKQGQDKPVIAVWGMMNAGKSYLLNMLTHHYNAEYFPTNDVRETAELRLFEESLIFSSIHQVWMLMTLMIKLRWMAPQKQTWCYLCTSLKENSRKLNSIFLSS